MKVSIILCVYNGQDYLSECLDSVLAQSYRKLELVIIDDGSDDRTDYIIECFKRQADELDIIHIKQDNCGLTKSLNTAIALATGDVIARLDADDYMHPLRVEKSLAYLIESDSHFLVTSAYRVCEEGQKGKKVPGTRLVNKEKFFNCDILLMGNPCIHGTFFGYKWVFLSNKYNESYRTAQDYEFLLRISKDERIVKIFYDEPLYYLRVHSKSVGRSMGSSQLSNAALIQSAYGGSSALFIPSSSGLRRLILSLYRRLRMLRVV